MKKFTAFSIIFSVAIFTTLFSSHSVKAATFTCSPKSTLTEKTICYNSDLGDMDYALKEIYRRALSTLPPSEAVTLKRDQFRWIRGRNNCGSDTRCISNAYTKRYDYIKELLDNFE